MKSLRYAAAIGSAALLIVMALGVVGCGSKQESQADKDAYFATHPAAKAAADNMKAAQQNPTPPPGAGSGAPRRTP